MLKKSAFYIFAVLFILASQFLASSSLISGTPPRIERTLLDGTEPMRHIAKGPALLYFWAEWCGVCRGMQDNVSSVLPDYPVLTVAESSGNSERISTYLSEHNLNWPVVNDHDGNIGETYGVRGVPALFFINDRGDIAFTSIGYTSEWGLRFRLWLTHWL